MTDTFTLEHYRLPSTPAHAGPADATLATGAVAPPPWSRRIVLDLAAGAELAAVGIAGLTPWAIAAAAGLPGLSWPAAIQAALLVALAHRCVVAGPGRPVSAPLPATLAVLSVAVAVAILLGAPAGLAGLDAAAWFVAWVGMATAASYGVRTAIERRLVTWTAAGRFAPRVAVCGSGPLARRVGDQLAADPSVRLVATHAADAGGLASLRRACRAGQLDHVVVAVLPGVGETRDGAMADIEAAFHSLTVGIDVATHVAIEGLPEAIGAVGLETRRPQRHIDWAPVIKRATDIVVAGGALLVFAPLVPVIALAIRLEGRGPILFRQRRHGRHGRVFEMLKFRSMRVMEDGPVIRQATADDDRITAVGRVLRRTSLDELPQLWNVLVGDMSVVGPRPHALAHDEAWGRAIPGYADRQQMKPGLTGLAQVQGFRGETRTVADVEDRVRQDVAYVRTWSPWLDVRILVATIGIVLQGINAH